MNKYQFVPKKEKIRRVWIHWARRCGCFDFRIQGIPGRLFQQKGYWKSLRRVNGCYWNNYGGDTGLDFVKCSDNKLEILVLTGIPYEALMERVEKCICSDCKEIKECWRIADNDPNRPICFDCFDCSYKNKGEAQ